MPLYEYKCGSCGDIFEVIQKFSDQPLTVHEKCGGPLERLISPPAFQFKGSGWYVTDYGKGNSKEAKPKAEGSNGTNKAEKSSGGAAESSSSESKSEKSTKSDSSATSTPATSKSESK